MADNTANDAGAITSGGKTSAPDAAETKPAGSGNAASATVDDTAPAASGDANAAASGGGTTANGRAAPAEPPPAAAAPAPAKPAEGSAPAVASADPDQTTAPKLQSVDGAVIIRRGDSLWRISRRVYGRGVRYSTIYLANQKEIEDPNRIWPGQVFRMPEKTNEGETADMKAIGEQATTVPAVQ